MVFEVVGLGLRVSRGIWYLGGEEDVAFGVAPEGLILWGFTVSLGCEVFIGTELYDDGILTGSFPYDGWVLPSKLNVDTNLAYLFCSEFRVKVRLLVGWLYSRVCLLCGSWL
jgi:hypothetical protein